MRGRKSLRTGESRRMSDETVGKARGRAGIGKSEDSGKSRKPLELGKVRESQRIEKGKVRESLRTRESFNTVTEPRMAAPFRNSLTEIGWLNTIIKSLRDLKPLEN
jgi:hypothetical protein